MRVPIKSQNIILLSPSLYAKRLDAVIITCLLCIFKTSRLFSDGNGHHDNQ